MSDIPREEVERMIRESGMSFHLGMPHEAVVEQMTRFASILRNEMLEAAEHAIQCGMEFEREACAKIAEDQMEEWVDVRPKLALKECAAAIRARSKE